MPLFALSDIQARVYSRLDNNSVLYGTAEVNQEINNSIVSVNLYTGVLQITQQQITTTTNNQPTLIYYVQAGMLFPNKIWFNNFPLRRMSLLALARLYPTWATDVSATSYQPAHWASIDMTTFVIHPMDSLASGQLTITGVQEPTPLVNPTDTIPFEDEDIELISDLTASVLQIKEGASRIAASAEMLKQYYREMKSKSMYQQNVNPRVYLPVNAAGNKQLSQEAA